MAGAGGAVRAGAESAGAAAVVFCDVSNTWHTGGRGGGKDALLQFVRSKQRRDDCRLVTLGLALDGLGLPLHFAVLSGNVAEPRTLEQSLRLLARGGPKGEAKPMVCSTDQPAGGGAGATAAHLLAAEPGGGDLPGVEDRLGAVADLAPEGAGDRRVPFLAMLAYHGVNLIRTGLRGGIRLSWTEIRERLAPWVRITTTLRAADGSLIVTRQDARKGAEPVEIARAVGVKPGLYRHRSVGPEDNRE